MSAQGGVLIDLSFFLARTAKPLVTVGIKELHEETLHNSSSLELDNCSLEHRFFNEYLESPHKGLPHYRGCPSPGMVA